MKRSMLFKIVSLILVGLLVFSFSIADYSTQPKAINVVSYDAVHKSLLNRTNLNLGNKTISYDGQSANFWFAFGTVTENWTEGNEFGMILYVAITWSQVHFPWNGVSINLSNFSILVNGVNVGILDIQHTLDSHRNLLAYILLVVSPNNFTGRVNLSINFSLELILLSWIYHFSVKKSNFLFEQPLKLS